MKRAVIGLLVAAVEIVVLSLALVQGAAAAGSVRLTIEDLLAAEDVGNVSFSPDGQWLAFERVAAVKGQPTSAFSQGRSRVFIGARAGREIVEITGATGASFQLAEVDAWAPDSAGLLLVQTLDDRASAVYWDVHTRRLTQLPGYTPQFLSLVTWVNGRVIYPGVPDDEVSQRTSNLQMLDQLQEKWRAAWTRPEPQITVSSNSPLFAPTAPRPGALMMAEPSKNVATKVADGDYLATFPSPDGKHVAALRSAEVAADSLFPLGRRSELQIFAINPTGMTLIKRFEDMDVGLGAVAWAPAANRVVLGGKLSGEKKSAVRLFEIDVRSGKRRDIALPPGMSIFKPDVAYGGAALLPFGWIGDQLVTVAATSTSTGSVAPAIGARADYGQEQNLRFDVYALAGGKARSLTSFARAPVANFLAPPGARFALVVADGALWRIAPGTSPERVSPQDAPPVMAFGAISFNPFDPSPRAAYFHSEGQERVALFAAGAAGQPERRVLDLRTRRYISPPAEGAASAGAGLRSVAAPDLTATVSTVHRSWEAALVLEDGGARELVTLNTALNERAVAPVERFTFTAGGREIPGWVVLPPGADRGKPLPAVVVVYGGLVFDQEPPPFARPGRFPGALVLSGQLWAAKGYAVIYPGMPLGRGADTDVMATLAEQAVAAVDALAAKGIVDPQRVGVMGHSFGGFSTAAILARRSDRFRAGVSLAGVYDFIYAFGTKALAQLLTDDGRDSMRDIASAESGQIQLGKPFWQDPAPYIRNSPIFHIESIDSPLLLLHGDLDLGTTSLAGADRMYNSLVHAGKTAALVRYWGDGHVATSEGVIRDQFARMSSWFDTYLQ